MSESGTRVAEGARVGGSASVRRPARGPGRRPVLPGRRTLRLGRLRPTRTSAPHLVLAALIVGQAGFLLYLAHDLWFVWGDDYDFFQLRGTIPGVNAGLWAPHDDHWMTAIVLIDRALFSVVGLHSYLPYVAVSIGLHLAASVVTYLMLLRVGVRPWTAVVAGVVAVFAGAGAQAVLWNTTAGLIGALTCGLVAIYLLERAGGAGRGRWVAVAVLVLGLTFSGTGIVAVLTAVVFTLVRWGRQAAAPVLLVPAAVFVAWYVAFGHNGAKAPLADRWDYLGVARYVWLGMTSSLEAASGIDGAGPLLLLALVAVVLGAPARVPEGLRAFAIAGLCGALGQLTLAAISRPSFGEDAFTGGRYGYLTLMFLVPAVAVALTVLVPLVTAPRAVAAGLALFVLVAYVVQASSLFRAEHDGRLFVSEPWPGIMKGLRAAAQAGEPVLTEHPPDDVHERFRADLAARKEFWDAIPEGEATPLQRLQAENLFFTGVDTEAFSVGGGAAIRLVLGFTSTEPIVSGCRRITATGDVAVLAIDASRDGAQFGISGPSTSAVTHLVRDGEQGPDRTWTLPADRGVWIATSASDAELVVNLGAAGDYDVCRL